MGEAMDVVSAKKQLYQDLCDLEIPSVIKISPNAQQVLYVTSLTWEQKKGKHAVSTLWMAETGRPGSSRKITPGTSKDYSPRWNPDGSGIAFLSDRAEAGKKWAIYMLDVKNGRVEGEAYPITDVDNERGISSFEFSPDGKRIAYICADPKTDEEKAREENGEDWQVWGQDWTFNKLRIVNLATAKVNTVTGHQPSVPERHVTRFCWSPDSENLVVVSQKSPHIEEPYLTGSDIAILWLHGLTIEDVCHFPNDVRNIQWAADGKLYFCSGIPADKCCAGQCVYVVPLEVQTEPPYAKRTQCKRAAFGKHNDVETLSLVSGDVVGKVQEGLEDQICLVPSGRVLYTAPRVIESFDAAYPADSDEIVLAIASSDVNKPVEVYTTTASGGGLVQLSDHGAAFAGHTFGQCEILNTRSADDKVDLDALLLTPSSSTSSTQTAMPTIVLIHGGPNSRITNAFNACCYFWTPYLLSLGYAVLLPNYRGSSGKGEDFAIWSNRPSGVGQYDYEDVITLTQYAIDLQLVDPDRIIVGGGSQGGFLSYLCGVRNDHGWHFKAAIPVAGVTDFDTLILTSDIGATVQIELTGGRSPWNMPKVDTRSRQASALWEFDAAMQRTEDTGKMVVPPMLIFHGEKDERCPITQAWGMRRALTSRNLPFEFVTYPRQGHIFTEQKFWIDMADRIGNWCEKYIGPGHRG